MGLKFKVIAVECEVCCVIHEFENEVLPIGWTVDYRKDGIPAVLCPEHRDTDMFPLAASTAIAPLINRWNRPQDGRLVRNLAMWVEHPIEFRILFPQGQQP